MRGFSRRSFASLLLIAFLITSCLPAARAQDAAAQAEAANTIHLDLSSTEASVAATNMGQEAIHVEMGGMTVPITAGSQVTPAQYVAIQQIMQTGTQSLILNSLGAAQAGTFHVNDSLSAMINSLTIPQGVTALHDAAGTAMVNLAGNLVNSGSFYAYTSNAAVNAATIAAQNITNNQSAILSTILPTALQASLNPALMNLTLNLSAINNIVNAGTISSSANLNLYAGGSITNAGVNGATAVMQAMQNLNMTAMSGQIQNSGVMAAMLGNINVQTATMANLTLNNTNGVMQALNGQINIRNIMDIAKVNTTLTGGDFISRQLNVFSGDGSADMNVNNISGLLNITAGQAHVSTISQNLSLGSMNLSGDPTFFNTGDIQITGDILVGERLSIISGQDIYIPNGATVNSITARTTNSGFDITIVAGANITTGTNPTSTVTGSPPSGAATTVVTINGASGTGGDIDFSAAPSLLIDSQGASFGPGGDITLAAYGTAIGGGHVIMPGTIRSTGSTTIGDITVLAGATSTAPIVVQSGASVSQAIVLGTIDALNSSAAGLLLVATAQPTSSTGLPMQFNTDGSVVNNATLIPASSLQSTNILLQGGLNTKHMIAMAGGTLTTTTAADVSNFSGGSVTFAGGAGLNLGGDISTQASAITLLSGGNIATTSPIAISTMPNSSPGSNTGDIRIFSGASYFYSRIGSDYSFSISGGTGGVGNISIQTGSQIISDRNGFSGNGGDIMMIAYNGTITLPGFGSPAFVISSGGAGTGRNGNITLIAGANTTSTAISSAPGCVFCVTFPSFWTSGGGGGNGNVTIASATPEIICPGCTSNTFTIGSFGTTTGYMTAGNLLPGDILINPITTGSNSLVQIYSTGTINVAGSVTACSGCALVGGSPTSTIVGCTGCTPVTNTNIPSSAIDTINNAGAFTMTIISAADGNITLGSGSALNIFAPDGAHFIANGSGNITQFSTSTINTTQLTLASGTGNIGTLTEPIIVGNTSPSILNWSGRASTAGGDVYILSVGYAALGASNAGSGKTFWLHTVPDGDGYGRITYGGLISVPGGTIDFQ